MRSRLSSAIPKPTTALARMGCLWSSGGSSRAGFRACSLWPCSHRCLAGRRVTDTFGRSLSSAAVVLFGLARIDCGDGLARILEVLRPFLAEVFFEKNGVARVGPEHGVRDVTSEGNETEDEVEGNVHEHLHLNAIWEAAFDFAARLEDQHSQESIKDVANAVHAS